MFEARLFRQVPIVGLSQAKKRPEAGEEPYCDPTVQDCPPAPAAGMYGTRNAWQPGWAMHPATIGQGTPAPAPVPPLAKKASIPVVLTVATLGGAALGVVLSLLVMPKITKMKMTTGPKITSGVIGGGVGGLIGAGVTLALKG